MSAHFCVSHPCPLCYPDRYISAPIYNLPPQPHIHPAGCICPPTSEKTCESPTCPRKGIKVSGARLGG
jgi:hypothetical protein